MLRVRFSRWLSSVLFGRSEMLCALADLHQWPIRHALNLMFLDRHHCAAAAEWEVAQVWPPIRDPAGELRREGL